MAQKLVKASRNDKKASGNAKKFSIVYIKQISTNNIDTTMRLMVFSWEFDMSVKMEEVVSCELFDFLIVSKLLWVNVLLATDSTVLEHSILYLDFSRGFPSPSDSAC